MRNILLALLALCFGAATAAKQALDDKTIRVAVRAWFDNRAAAEAEYGHISTWETGGVTDMSWLFCARQSWTPARKSPRRDDWLLWLLRQF